MGSVRNSGCSGSAIFHFFTYLNTGEFRADSRTASPIPSFLAWRTTSGSNGSRIISRWASTSSWSGRMAVAWMRSASYSNTPR